MVGAIVGAGVGVGRWMGSGDIVGTGDGLVAAALGVEVAVGLAVGVTGSLAGGDDSPGRTGGIGSGGSMAGAIPATTIASSTGVAAAVAIAINSDADWLRLSVRGVGGVSTAISGYLSRCWFGRSRGSVAAPEK